MTPVYMLTPGGLEHGGGIGRMIGYLLQAWQGDPSAPRAEVLDTRGPGQLSVAPAIFARALLKVAGAGLRRRDRPLLHIHVAGRGSTLRKAMIAPLAAALGLRTVVHLHDYDYGGFLDTLPRAALGPVRFLFRRARAVVVLGARDRDTVVERLGVDPARVRVVPNAVPDPGPPPPREPGGAVRLLFLGDPSRRKGVHDLLAALARPELAGRTDWTCIVAGGGRELDGFRADVTRLGLADRITLPGWLPRPQVQALLRQADVLVLPSYAEGLAMSVLEGMSHGLCVVCTPVGALSEVVEDGADGLLHAPGDVPALAAALQRAIADSALRARLGAAARATFLQRYDLRDYPARIAQAYALALA